MYLDPRLLRQIQGARVWLVLTLLLGTLNGILVILQALTLSRILARVLLEGAALAEVWPSMLALLALMVGRAVLTWVSEVSAFQVAAQCKRDLRARLLNHLVALGPAYVRGERTGELINTAVEGIEALEAYLSQYLPQLVLAALLPLLVLAFILPLDLVSGLVLLLTGPLIPLFMVLIGKAAEALTHRQWRTLSRMSAYLLDVLQGLTTLKILGRSRDQVQTIARVSDAFRATTLGVLRVAFLSAFALEMIATLSTAIVAVEIGLRLLYGQLLFEQAFFILVLAPDFYLPLRLLGTRFHAGLAGVAAAQRIFEVLETPATPAPPIVHRSPASGSASSAVVFDNVHYAYDGVRSALDGVSFTLAPGQRVALVGPTGAGKSTIVNLLMRFVEPNSGEIRCNGVPLREWSPAEWRAQVAWVPQNPYWFDDTVAANIALPCPDARPEEIERAAQLAHADEFIRALPDGYATRIGERGARLSGGQAQRLALARALLQNAPLLILDEAMSNLDAENAALIEKAAVDWAHERTVLIITHRLEPLVSADRIIVLAGGRVVECGTHASLVRQEGLYRRFVTAGLGEVAA